MEKVGAFTERATAEGEWRPGDPATGQKATPMLAQYFNMLQRELLAILSAGGVVPDIDTENQVLAAIQRLSGRSVTTVTNADSPKALTVAEAGLVLVDATDGDVTLTLPTAVSNGGLEYTVIRTDDTANAVTVTPDGTDTIDGAASTDVAKTQRYQMVCDGSDTWQLPVPFASEGLAGLIQLATQFQVDALTSDATAVSPKTLGVGFSISLGSPGYIVFPKWLGGLIVQWGVNDADDVSYSLPITFPNAPLCGQVTDKGLANQAEVSCDFPSNSEILLNSEGSPSITTVFWLALGY